jgi:hypothetical protein
MTKMSNWKIHGTENDRVRSIMTNAHEKFSHSVRKQIPNKTIEYSGIVISPDEETTDSEQIEKRCYEKGGFKFLYKSYDDQNPETSPPLANEIRRFLESITPQYLRNLNLPFATVELQSCWIVCQRDGDYGTLHNHTSPGIDQSSLYSGMLYLDVPESINPTTFPNGCLHLIGESEIIYVPPIPGCVTLWPADVIHGIHPFRGAGDRTGIAFNISCVTNSHAENQIENPNKERK